MAKQVIQLGTPPSGVGGDTPRSANIKINENFTEVYDRQAKLGTASNANIGTGPGQVMTVGAFGLGASSAPGSTFSGVVGFTNHAGGASETPAPGSGGTRITQNVGGNLFNEITITANSINAPVLAYRQYSASGIAGTWNIVYTNQNTTRATDGTLKAI